MQLSYGDAPGEKANLVRGRGSKGSLSNKGTHNKTGPPVPTLHAKSQNKTVWQSGPLWSII